MTDHHGQCLCGQTGYDTGGDPLWVTVCYCRFCQHATGSDRMIEPIFERAGFCFTGAAPSVYTLPSEGSGQDIHVHFCATCGTHILTRIPGAHLVLKIGTLDDPAWFAAPKIAIYTIDRQPFHLIPDIPEFERLPPPQ